MGLETRFGRTYAERFCVSDYRLGRLPSRLTQVTNSRISPHTVLNGPIWKLTVGAVGVGRYAHKAGILRYRGVAIIAHKRPGWNEPLN